MKAFCSAGTMRGNKSTNQDRFSVDDKVLSFDSPRLICDFELELNKDNLHIVAVADGVTNSLDGGKAAEIVTEKIFAAFKQGEFNNGESLNFKEKIDNMMKEVAAEIRWVFKEYESASAATTISIAILNEDTIWAYNLGDSPIFLITKGTYIPLFTEDTVGAQMVRENQKKGFIGKFFKKQEISEKDFNCLTNCISGNRYFFDGNFVTMPFLSDDILLIATDGLFKAVEKETVTADSNVDNIFDMAEKYADDDVTVVLIKKEGSSTYDANKDYGEC